MYKNFHNFNINKLIKMRLHLGHHSNTLNSNLTSYIYGTRHNINIYNLNKLWTPYRYLFYSLVKNFARRNTFFVVGTNPNLPMPLILENLLLQYPFEIEKNLSYYISGYVDKKWIGGLFSNWKIFSEFIQYMEKPLEKPNSNVKKKKYRFQKYFLFLKGIKNLAKMPFPDFVIFLNDDAEAMFEIKKLQIPLIGLVDTNMNPNDFLYKFFGNNDSTENIEFFFTFLKEAVQEGRLKEQQLFYYYFIYKLKTELLSKKI
jgi:small subunit ribosomal protein S2